MSEPGNNNAIISKIAVVLVRCIVFLVVSGELEMHGAWGMAHGEL